jgi:hypothetical protein
MSYQQQRSSSDDDDSWDTSTLIDAPGSSNGSDSQMCDFRLSTYDKQRYEKNTTKTSAIRMDPPAVFQTEYGFLELDENLNQAAYETRAIKLDVIAALKQLDADKSQGLKIIECRQDQKFSEWVFLKDVSPLAYGGMPFYETAGCTANGKYR